MEIMRIGLDLAKNVFQVHGVGPNDNVVLRKTLRREAVASFLPICRLASWEWRRAAAVTTGRGCFWNSAKRFA